MAPSTSRVALAVAVAIPTLPADDTLTLSDPPVNILRSSVTPPIRGVLVVLLSLKSITDPAVVLSKNATVLSEVCTCNFFDALLTPIPNLLLDSTLIPPVNSACLRNLEVLTTNRSVPPAPTFLLIVPSRFSVILSLPAVVDQIPTLGLIPLPCAAG